MCIVRTPFYSVSHWLSLAKRGQSSLLTLWVILCLFSISACKKKEGEGGKYSIKGTVSAKYYDQNLSVYTGEKNATDEDVFIIYGGETGYGDKVSTDYKGEFEFRYLRSGDYTVFVYADDTSQKSQSGEIAIVKQVRVDGDTDMGTIHITKQDKRKLDEGPYSISGTVSVKFCNTTYTYCTGPFGTPDIDVFICKLGEVMHFDRIRTSEGGFYKFMYLPAGSYVVYVTSQNPLSAVYETEPPIIVKKDTVTITQTNVSNIDFETVE